jgi:hypothetical protein
MVEVQPIRVNRTRGRRPDSSFGFGPSGRYGLWGALKNDTIESGEDVPEPLRVLFAAWVFGGQPSQRGIRCLIASWLDTQEAGWLSRENWSDQAGPTSPFAFMIAKRPDGRRWPRSEKTLASVQETFNYDYSE